MLSLSGTSPSHLPTARLPERPGWYLRHAHLASQSPSLASPRPGQRTESLHRVTQTIWTGCHSQQCSPSPPLADTSCSGNTDLVTPPPAAGVPAIGPHSALSAHFRPLPSSLPTLVCIFILLFNAPHRRHFYQAAPWRYMATLVPCASFCYYFYYIVFIYLFLLCLLW